MAGYTFPLHDFFLFMYDFFLIKTPFQTKLQTVVEVT
jgi:hypothetical protein